MLNLIIFITLQGDLSGLLSASEIVFKPRHGLLQRMFKGYWSKEAVSELQPVRPERH